MSRISQHLTNLSELPAVLDAVRSRLQYHTESGFTGEEANSYAQQVDDLEAVLVPAWSRCLTNATYGVDVECAPKLGGFLKIRIQREGAEPVLVFAEPYVHFNAEMFDGSCHQYLYQSVLCYEEGLTSGRIPLE